MDQVKIVGLRCECIIGTFDHERHEKQPVIFNITLSTDLQVAGESDDLNDTVDYFTLQHDIMDFVGQSSFALLEALAEEVAKICLKDSRVKEAVIEVEKPMALNHVKTVAIEITRQQ